MNVVTGCIKIMSFFLFCYLLTSNLVNVVTGCIEIFIGGECGGFGVGRGWAYINGVVLSRCTI